MWENGCTGNSSCDDYILLILELHYHAHDPCVTNWSLGLLYDYEPHLVYSVFLKTRWSLSIVYNAIYDMNYDININNNAYHYYHYYKKTYKYFSLLL